MDPQFRNQQAFNHLAKSITLNDILNDFITTYDINRSLEEVQVDWQRQLGNLNLELEEQIALVKNDGEIVGYVDALDIYTPADPVDNLTLKHCFHSIETSMIVSCDTSIIDFVGIAAYSQHFAHFVIKGNRFIGWASYNDLNKSAFHLCLFAIILDLEEKLLYALSKTPKSAFGYLSESRQKKASDLYKVKFKRFSTENGDPFYPKLIECCMVVDKFEMMSKIPLSNESIPALQKVKNWRLVEKIRNIIAHPGVGVDMLEKIQKKDLVPFIAWIFELTDQLVDYCNDQTINQ
jgi:hypothetical protein